MSIVLSTPQVGELGRVLGALSEWQLDGSQVQLHPGDLGWFWRFGAETTAAAVRCWSRDGRMLAIGLLDGDDLIRLAVSPEAALDGELAARLVADVGDPARGVLPAGAIHVEARYGDAVRARLASDGWQLDDPWTPLSRDLSDPIEPVGIRIEVVDEGLAAVRAELQRAAFAKSVFTEQRWQVMASGPAYADARCLVGFDVDDTPVAAITVWSAGVGRPGLIEPMGAHEDHRGHGYGTAITLAGASALRDLGCSHALVCTESSNIAGVATYVAAGFQKLPEVRDFSRPAA